MSTAIERLEVNGIAWPVPKRVMQCRCSLRCSNGTRGEGGGQHTHTHIFAHRVNTSAEQRATTSGFSIDCIKEFRLSWFSRCLSIADFR